MILKDVVSIHPMLMFIISQTDFPKEKYPFQYIPC